VKSILEIVTRHIINNSFYHIIIIRCLFHSFFSEKTSYHIINKLLHGCLVCTIFIHSLWKIINSLVRCAHSFVSNLSQLVNKNRTHSSTMHEVIYMSHNVYCKKYHPCKRYNTSSNRISYILYKLRSSSVQERIVYTAFAEKINIYFKMESSYMFATMSIWFFGEFERKFFRLPGYFELCRVLEWGHFYV
jgi:hypothetical protein